MKVTKGNLAVGNIRGATREGAVKWTAGLMAALRPGGVWVIPRTVSCVYVLSGDPPIARVRSIVRDDELVETLIAAGWSVQVSNVGEN